ncbi:MAG: 1-acyl-sn-glycerol-3-phosphate acyltransferase [Bacteroidales bacterium]|nr:1-acyl-sn-glycerol-3-phosphate acyltransferase [Bacteroidales bacterium]
MPVITPEEIAALVPRLKGKDGLVRAGLSLTGVDKVNALYDRCLPAEGADFAAALLRDVGVDYLVGGFANLAALADGPFITISNHPYGHMDGIITVDLVGHVRPGFKLMVNKVLGRIRAMAVNFIEVDPTGSERQAATQKSVGGVREALSNLQRGEPLGLFPSGAVSDLSIRDGFRIRDRQWQEAALKIIRKAAVPVLPIRFFDRNSLLFYLLGLIDYRVRLVRLCHEMFNKKNRTVRVGIGPVIYPMEFSDMSPEELSGFLRDRVYGMPMPSELVRRSSLFAAP